MSGDGEGSAPEHGHATAISDTVITMEEEEEKLRQKLLQLDFAMEELQERDLTGSIGEWLFPFFDCF